VITFKRSGIGLKGSGTIRAEVERRREKGKKKYHTLKEKKERLGKGRGEMSRTSRDTLVTILAHGKNQKRQSQA